MKKLRLWEMAKMAKLSTSKSSAPFFPTPFFLVIPDSLGNIQAKVRGVRKVEKGFAVVTVVNVYWVLSANQELYFTCNFQSSQETGTINCTQEDSKAYPKLVYICPSAYSMREI